MSLRRYKGFAFETGTEGVMALRVFTSKTEFKTMDDWLLRNGIRFDGPEQNCIVDEIEYKDNKGEGRRLYTFLEIKPEIVAFRLSFHHLSIDLQLWLAYCEHLLRRCELLPIPKHFRKDSDLGFVTSICQVPFFTKIEEWTKASGIRLINLYELLSNTDTSQLPIKGRNMFIYYDDDEQYKRLMPIVLFILKSDAVLYKLALL